MIRRTRRRAPAWALAGLITLLVLTALAYGFDVLARRVADARVAATVRSATHVSSVTASIHGTFFIPQLVSGNYSHVQVTLHGLQAQGLEVSTLRTDLYQVRLPFSEVVHQDVKSITVERTREQALVTFTAINRYLKDSGQHLTLSNGTNGQVAITTQLDAFGHTFTVEADATVKPGHAYVDVIPTTLHTSSALINAVGDAVLKLRLAFRVPMTPLPFGQNVRTVQTTSAGLQVIATGSQVVLTQQGVTAAGG